MNNIPQPPYKNNPLPLLEIGINSIALDCKPKGNDPVFSRMRQAWRTEEVAPVDMEYYVQAGYTFTAALTGAQRDKQFFLSCQHVCLDFDTDDERSTLAAVSALPGVSKYGSFLYTTMSHTPEAPRCRAVFFLSEPMTDKSEYEACVRGMLARYDYADPIAKDATRIYFGSKGCELRILREEMVLPIDVFRQWGQEHKERQERMGRLNQMRANANARIFGKESTTYKGTLGPKLVDDVRTAPKGSRNSTFYTKGIKARQRFDPAEAEHWIGLMKEAAIANDLSEREADTAYNSIMRSVLL